MALTPRGFLVKSPSSDQPPRYGILASTTSQTVTDPHWQATGIEWEDFLCGDGLETFIDECPPVSGYTLPAERNTQFCAADPFLVVGSYECPPVGRPTGEAFEIARKRLLVWESHQVEEALWTGVANDGNGGTVSVNPSFAYGNVECDITPVDIHPSGALAPVAALGLIEEALSDIVASGGTIHIPYNLVAQLAEHHLIRIGEDGSYVTPTGLKVIAGSGYPGTGPENTPADDGETWIFATGPLVLVRGNVITVPDRIGESLDRTINNVTVRAERFYAVGFSCALLAVRVTICSDC